MGYSNEIVQDMSELSKYIDSYLLCSRKTGLAAVRSWTINRQDSSVLIKTGTERDDMYSEGIEEKFGEYIKDFWIFCVDSCWIELETIFPKMQKSLLRVMYVVRINLLGCSFENRPNYLNSLRLALEENRGVGVFGEYYSYKVRVDFSGVTL